MVEGGIHVNKTYLPCPDQSERARGGQLVVGGQKIVVFMFSSVNHNSLGLLLKKLD